MILHRREIEYCFRFRFDSRSIKWGCVFTVWEYWKYLFAEVKRYLIQLIKQNNTNKIIVLSIKLNYFSYKIITRLSKED